MTQPQFIKRDAAGRFFTGPRLQMQPSDLDAAAMVTPLDVMLARALWQRYAPARYLDMLDAMEVV